MRDTAGYRSANRAALAVWDGGPGRERVLECAGASPVPLHVVARTCAFRGSGIALRHRAPHRVSQRRLPPARGIAAAAARGDADFARPARQFLPPGLAAALFRHARTARRPPRPVLPSGEFRRVPRRAGASGGPVARGAAACWCAGRPALLRGVAVPAGQPDVDLVRPGPAGARVRARLGRAVPARAHGPCGARLPGRMLLQGVGAALAARAARTAGLRAFRGGGARSAGIALASAVRRRGGALDDGQPVDPSAGTHDAASLGTRKLRGGLCPRHPEPARPRRSAELPDRARPSRRPAVGTPVPGAHGARLARRFFSSSPRARDALVRGRLAHGVRPANRSGGGALEQLLLHAVRRGRGPARGHGLRASAGGGLAGAGDRAPVVARGRFVGACVRGGGPAVGLDLAPHAVLLPARRGGDRHAVARAAGSGAEPAARDALLLRTCRRGRASRWARARWCARSTATLRSSPTSIPSSRRAPRPIIRAGSFPGTAAPWVRSIRTPAISISRWGPIC